MGPGFVRRPRLERTLANIAITPLTTVVAPHGSGKTTALGQFARASELDVRWMTLEAQDDRPDRFWPFFFAALADTHHEWRDAEGVLSTLADLSWATGPAVLVIDDYHHIHDPEIAETMARVLRFLPSTLHVVVSGVSTPDLPIHRIRLEGRLLEIGELDLTMDLDEVTSVVEAVTGQGFDRAGLERIVERTEGWPTGVRLAGLALLDAAPGDPEEPVTPPGQRRERQLLLDELERLPESTRAFLLATSVLDELTPALCDGLTGRPTGRALLEELRLDGLFLVRVPNRPQWYRHRAFGRELLQLEAVRRDPSGQQLAHRRAAAWLDAYGDPGAAFEHHLAAGDHEDAWRVLRSTLGGGSSPDHGVELERRFRAIPTPYVRDDRGRMVDAAEILMELGHADEASLWLRSCEQELATTEVGLEARIQLTWARCHHFWGDIDGAVHAMEQAIDLGPAPTETLTDAAPLLELSHLRVLAGDAAGAQRALVELPSLGIARGWYDDVFTETVRAEVALHQERLVDAMRLAGEAIARAETNPDGGGEVVGLARFVRGCVLLEWGDLYEAIADLEAAHAPDAFGTPVVGRVLTSLALARARFATGRQTDGLCLIADARRGHGDRPLAGRLRGLVDGAEARLLLLSGQPDDARALIAGLPDGAQKTLLSAWASLVEGRASEATERLLGLRAPGRIGIERELLLVQALHEDAGGGLDHTRAAVTLGWPDRHLLVFIEHGMGVAGALRRLRSVDSSVYVSEMVRAIGSFAADPDPDGFSLVEPLTDRELAVVLRLRGRLPFQEIASDMDISLNTLKTHVKAVYRKFGVASRAEAVERAARLGLLGKTWSA
jgi:LuxR family maltose regulon positive regulatory protein